MSEEAVQDELDLEVLIEEHGPEWTVLHLVGLGFGETTAREMVAVEIGEDDEEGVRI